MGVEGALRVGLRTSRGFIESIVITSTRPDVARNLLQGRSRAEVAVAVPLLFSICGRSQAAASELACAAASAELTPDLLSRCAVAVSAETVRECAWRTLLDWPQWIGERPADAAVAAARASLAFRFGAPSDGNALDVAAFGIDASQWLSLRSLPELDRWIDAGPTATARFLRHLRDEDCVFY